MLQEPTSHRVDAETGTLSNHSRTYQKRLSDLAGLYADSNAFEAMARNDGERIVYAVQDFHPPQQVGDLIFGVTRMEPGKVGDEFFLTRGHIHARANRPEIYTGEGGHGLLLMESPEGETRIIAITPRIICYVPPFWIHRLINTGNAPLVMSFAYPGDSGQNYSVIAATAGMRQRIFADGDGWKLVPNADYRPRDAAAIQEIYATGDTA